MPEAIRQRVEVDIDSPRKFCVTPISPFTPVQTSILEALIHGCSYAQIAKKQGIRETMVERHILGFGYGETEAESLGIVGIVEKITGTRIGAFHATKADIWIQLLKGDVVIEKTGILDNKFINSGQNHSAARSSNGKTT